jgi:Fe2+ transport system protein B
MANVIGNAFAIALLLFIIVGLAIGLTILNPMMSAVTSATAGVAPSSSTYYAGVYADYKAFFMTNFTFLVYLIVLLIFYTSFGTENTLKSYISMIAAGVIMTVVMSQIATLFWNAVAAQSIIDFSDFTANLWFISNIQNIFIVNLLIAMCSFVFIPKTPRNVTS